MNILRNIINRNYTNNNQSQSQNNNPRSNRISNNITAFSFINNLNPYIIHSHDIIEDNVSESDSENTSENIISEQPVNIQTTESDISNVLTLQIEPTIQSIIDNELFRLHTINNINYNYDGTSNTSRYYSTFFYNNLEVSLFHSEFIEQSQIDIFIETIITNFNNYQLDNVLLNSFNNENNTINEEIDNEENIAKILSFTKTDKYEILKNISKNDICPITLNNFEDNTVIALFTKCNHSILNECVNKYIKMFDTCPLCKTSLM